MGWLRYDGMVTEFEDRLLTHLQIVVMQKLQRGESFVMSWKDSRSAGDGRTAIWLAPDIPITFKFSGGHLPKINREWLNQLGTSADSSTGLIVTTESGELAEADETDGLYPGNLDARRKKK